MSNFHYTKAVHLPSIINEGKILTTLVTGDKNEKPAVWFTSSEEWEPCCNAGKMDPCTKRFTAISFDEMQEIFGICRIKISEKLPTISWAKFKYAGKISDAEHYKLTEFSRKRGGKTDLWNCSLNPVNEEYFESIEMLVDNDWLTWDRSVSIEDFIELCHSCNSSNRLPEVKAMNFNKIK